jgi:hypothetical protein
MGGYSIPVWKEYRKPAVYYFAHTTSFVSREKETVLLAVPNGIGSKMLVIWNI